MQNVFFEKDHLFIDRFEVACRVGTTAGERAFPQIVTLTLRIFTPLAKAGKSDSLRETVDYYHILQRVKTLLSRRKFQLIEAVAETVAQAVFKDKNVDAVHVQALKKVFADVRGVGCSIYRSR